MMMRLARAGTREIMLTDTVKFARAAGESGVDDPAPPCAAADRDPDRDGLRARIRLDAGVRRRHRDDLLLARHRQADHRFDPSLDRPVMVAYLMLVALRLHHDQSAGRSRLRGARSAPAERGAHDRSRPSPVAPLLGEFRESTVAVVGAGGRRRRSSLLALLAPLIAPQNPYDLASLVLTDARRPPGYRRLAAASSIGSAPTRRAATCCRRSSTACASRSRSGSSPARSPSSSARRSASSPPSSADGCEALIMRIVDLQLSFPGDPARAGAVGRARPGQVAADRRAGRRAVRLFRPHRAWRGVDRALEGLRRGGAVDAAVGSTRRCSAISCRTACRR